MTWDHRIVNPKTGKLMPAHVNRDGHLVGTGQCPFWLEIASIKERNKATREKQEAAEAFRERIKREQAPAGPSQVISIPALQVETVQIGSEATVVQSPHNQVSVPVPSPAPEVRVVPVGAGYEVRVGHTIITVSKEQLLAINLETAKALAGTG